SVPALTSRVPLLLNAPRIVVPVEVFTMVPELEMDGDMIELPVSVKLPALVIELEWKFSRLPSPVKVAVAPEAMDRTREPSRSGKALVSTDSVEPEAMVVVPESNMEPLFHVSEPVTVRLPAPLSVPPESVSVVSCEV